MSLRQQSKPKARTVIGDADASNNAYQDEESISKGLNSIILQHLESWGLEESYKTFCKECQLNGVALPNDLPSPNFPKIGFNFRDGRKLVAYFDEEKGEELLEMWTRFTNDLDSSQKQEFGIGALTFYIYIYAAIIPFRQNKSEEVKAVAMTKLRHFFQDKPHQFHADTNMLQLFALPFVTDPMEHPIFKDIFMDVWKEKLKNQVNATISQYFQSFRKVAGDSELTQMFLNHIPPETESDDEDGQIGKSDGGQLKKQECKNINEDESKRLHEEREKDAEIMRQMKESLQSANAQNHNLNREIQDIKKKLYFVEDRYYKLIKSTAEVVSSLELAVQGKFQNIEELRYKLQEVFPELFSPSVITDCNGNDPPHPEGGAMNVDPRLSDFDLDEHDDDGECLWEPVADIAYESSSSNESYVENDNGRSGTATIIEEKWIKPPPTVVLKRPPQEPETPRLNQRTRIPSPDTARTGRKESVINVKVPQGSIPISNQVAARPRQTHPNPSMTVPPPATKLESTVQEVPPLRTATVVVAKHPHPSPYLQDKPEVISQESNRSIRSNRSVQQQEVQTTRSRSPFTKRQSQSSQNPSPNQQHLQQQQSSRSRQLAPASLDRTLKTHELTSTSRHPPSVQQQQHAQSISRSPQIKGRASISPTNLRANFEPALKNERPYMKNAGVGESVRRTETRTLVPAEVMSHKDCYVERAAPIATTDNAKRSRSKKSEQKDAQNSQPGFNPQPQVAQVTHANKARRRWVNGDIAGPETQAPPSQRRVQEKQGTGHTTVVTSSSVKVLEPAASSSSTSGFGKEKKVRGAAPQSKALTHPSI